jgi:hypothetical protein
MGAERKGQCESDDANGGARRERGVMFAGGEEKSRRSVLCLHMPSLKWTMGAIVAPPSTSSVVPVM